MGCILFSSRITRPFGTQRIVEVVWPGDERSRIRNMPASAVLSAARPIRRRTTLYPVARKFGVVGRQDTLRLGRRTAHQPYVVRRHFFGNGAREEASRLLEKTTCRRKSFSSREARRSDGWMSAAANVPSGRCARSIVGSIIGVETAKSKNRNRLRESESEVTRKEGV